MGWRMTMKTHGSRKLFMLAGVLILSGCASTRIRQLSGDDFQKQAQQCSLMGSFAWTSYIGLSHQNAYLEYGHPAFIGKGMSTTVYWTPLSELPSNVVVQLKTGRPPWTKWMDTGCIHGALPELNGQNLVSVHLDDVAVRDAVGMIFRINAWKIVAFDVPEDELVKIHVTVHLDNVPWREALLAITASARLETMFTPDGYIRIRKAK